MHEGNCFASYFQCFNRVQISGLTIFLQNLASSSFRLDPAEAAPGPTNGAAVDVSSLYN